MNPQIEPYDVAVGRGKIYYWLARLYLLSPTYQDLVRALDSQLLQVLRASLNEKGQQSIEWLTTFAKNLDATAAEQLCEKFYELFSVPIPGKYVPPYESCFRERISANPSGYGEILGAASMKVKAFYTTNGFEPTTANTPPDHIGIELLFMSKMCEREAEAIIDKREGDYGNIRKQELKFLSEHLYAWIPHFAQELGKVKNIEFYTNLAELTKMFAGHDMNYLSGTITGTNNTC